MLIYSAEKSTDKYKKSVPRGTINQADSCYFYFNYKKII